MKKIYFWPSTFCIHADDIWFVYGHFAVLCKYSISNKQVTVVGKIPVNDMHQESLFLKIIYLEDKLFLIPCWANEIIVYDISDDTFETIGVATTEGLKFTDAYIYDGRIICIPYSYQAIVSINPEKLELSLEYSLKECFEKNNISYFNDSEMLDDKTVIMVSPSTNGVWLYSVEHRVLSCVYVGDGDDKYSSVAIAGQYIILCSNLSRKIYKYDLINRKIQATWWPSGRKAVKIMTYSDDAFVVDDIDSSWMGIYNVDFDELTCIVSETIKERENYCTFLVGIMEANKEIKIYFDNADATFLFFNEDFTYEQLSIKIDEEHKKLMQNIQYSLDASVRECEMFSLESFLESIIVKE